MSFETRWLSNRSLKIRTGTSCSVLTEPRDFSN